MAADTLPPDLCDAERAVLDEFDAVCRSAIRWATAALVAAVLMGALGTWAALSALGVLGAVGGAA